ncbi:hypothetical protein ACI2KD_15215 [Pseudomonas monteilii]
MDTISDALKGLSAVHAKHKISGRFLASDDASTRWPPALPCSVELEAFYNQSEPHGVQIETGLTPLKLFDVTALEKAQTGYRWINTTRGLVSNDEWPAQYLVIIDDIGGGKPIMAVTNIKNTPVLASYDCVEPFKIADSLTDFISALTKLIDIVYDEFYIFDISNDDGISNTFMARVNNEIAPILGDDNRRRFVDYFYG